MANAVLPRLKDTNDKEFIANEGASHNITGTLTDLSDPPVTVTTITTLLVEIYDEDSGDRIVAEEDANNANGHTFSSGVFTIEVDGGDNVIKHPANVEPECLEWHVCRLTWTWSDGDSTRKGLKEYRFPVKRLKVTQ